ncbi:N-acetylneuraminate synthase family protein [Geofilum sp. OHC36d9]|uniref:N-acetylneuraminate synthase family protein n=1 Tax=Geofilum sp. OHC36d9 TaxID=3458413 RepID=UPI0040342727
MPVPEIIAEIGCNHKGDMAIAKVMITTAAIFCKADVIKFQKRTPKELLSETEYNSPHPNPENSYGSTYGAHREFLELNIEQHKLLKAWCEELGVTYSCSVWNMTSAKEIASLNPKLIKIPSACNLKFEMLQYLCENYPGEIHISFGMTTHEEEERIVTFFKKYNRANDLVIYSCTSGYPVAFDDVCLYEITRLKQTFEKRVKKIGFSGHHLGIATDIAAITLGAEWIERHFTLDRTWKGTDHAASLEPDGMRRLVRDIRNVYKTFSYKDHEILDIEEIQKKKN